jgi:acyl carrier protein
VKETFISKLAEISCMKESDISEKSIFWKDIILDSVDIGELKIFIKNNYNIQQDIDIINIQTFWDLCEYVTSLKNI